MLNPSGPETQPNEFSDSELHTSRIDQHKAQIDVLKHVATLDTGTLLVVMAIIEKVFASPYHQWLVGAGVVCLLASLCASGLACMSVLAAFPRKGARRLDRTDRRDQLVAMTVTFLGFLFGVVLIALFFAINWFSRS